VLCKKKMPNKKADINISIILEQYFYVCDLLFSVLFSISSLMR